MTEIIKISIQFAISYFLCTMLILSLIFFSSGTVLLKELGTKNLHRVKPLRYVYWSALFI